MGASEEPVALTDIEYKLLLVAYIHAKADPSMNKGKVISFLFAAAGPVGNNPASMPALLAELKVESIAELEVEVNGFALSAKRGLLAALKETRVSVLNALPPDFPASSREDCDKHVKPVLGSLAKKVQVLQEAASAEEEEAAAAEAAAAEAAEKAPDAAPAEAEQAEAAPPPKPKAKPVQLRAMIWQPPITASRTAKLGGADSTQRQLMDAFDGDLVLGAGALMYRIRVEGDVVLVQHYEMYGEHRPQEDATFPLGQRFVIGRSPQAQHRRPEQDADPGSRGLSRLHVAVTVHRAPPEGLTIQLEDLGSTNGTPVWWNRPSRTPAAPMKHVQELKKSTGKQTVDASFDGDAWIGAGSLMFRILVEGDTITVTHHGADPSRTPLPDEPRQHAVGTPFTIGRDPSTEHCVPREHPGAAALSRKHVTVHVESSNGELRLKVEDHSSNGSVVWWNDVNDEDATLD